MHGRQNICGCRWSVSELMQNEAAASVRSGYTLREDDELAESRRERQQSGARTEVPAAECLAHRVPREFFQRQTRCELRQRLCQKPALIEKLIVTFSEPHARCL